MPMFKGKDLKLVHFIYSVRTGAVAPWPAPTGPAVADGTDRKQAQRRHCTSTGEGAGQDLFWKGGGGTHNWNLSAWGCTLSSSSPHKTSHLSCPSPQTNWSKTFSFLFPSFLIRSKVDYFKAAHIHQFCNQIPVVICGSCLPCCSSKMQLLAGSF